MCFSHTQSATKTENTDIIQYSKTVNIKQTIIAPYCKKLDQIKYKLF